MWASSSCNSSASHSANDYPTVITSSSRTAPSISMSVSAIFQLFRRGLQVSFQPLKADFRCFHGFIWMELLRVLNLWRPTYSLDAMIWNCITSATVLLALSPLLAAFSTDSARPANQPSPRGVAASDLTLVSSSRAEHPSNLWRRFSARARAAPPVITDLHP